MLIKFLELGFWTLEALESREYGDNVAHRNKNYWNDKSEPGR